MPAAPCIWMAWSMIWQQRSGTMAFTALTHTRASALPRVSIALAASAPSGAWPRSRCGPGEMTSMFLPRFASFLPKASRLMPRSTIISMARSAAPMERMQWWMRPGPRRTCEISKPAALAEQDVLLRHAHVVEADVHVAVRARRRRRTRASGRRSHARGVHRHQDLRLLLVGVGVGAGACTIVIMILQRGSPAPEM
jgi:hypothetical protein